MATAEPTHADDADPGPGPGPEPDRGPGSRIRLPAHATDDPADDGLTDNEPREPVTPESKAPESKTSESKTSESGTQGRRTRLKAFALRHPVAFVTVVAGLLHVVWFFTFANSGGDLAAQDAWAEFVGRHPDSAYNLAWYGGMHPVSYSVVSPYLMSVLGVRTTMMIAGTISAGLLTMILIRSRAIRQPLA